MRALKQEDVEGRSQHAIHIGGVFASRRPAVVRTVLGSCIAVCLYDPTTGVGGMNHFLLPIPSTDHELNARYGIHAMEVLINACMKRGGERRRFEAKVFGGGHVLRIAHTEQSVPQSNIRFVQDFLQTEDIPIVSGDLGDSVAREVHFFTDTARVLLKRIPCDAANTAALTTIENKERARIGRLAGRTSRRDESNITLF